VHTIRQAVESHEALRSMRHKVCCLAELAFHSCACPSPARPLPTHRPPHAPTNRWPLRSLRRTAPPPRSGRGRK
jgi:hypothetical protein